MLKYAVALMLGMMAASVQALASPPLTADAAKVAFAEAKQVSDRDGGNLWGVPFYGPTLIVDPVSRTVFANMPDKQGKLKDAGGVYTGKADDALALGNTVAEWAGRRWAMWLWPLPDNVLLRRTVMMHESFHRFEPALGIPIENAICLHMDKMQARILEQLEWRALALALASAGKAQDDAIRDALAFRAKRRGLYSGAGEQERKLELAEGLAEASGMALAMPDRESARWAAIARLTNPEAQGSYARNFIFTSVPAYWRLLDIRRPGWRKAIRADSDLGAMLEKTLPGRVHAAPDDAAYGAMAIAMVETERAAAIEARRAHFHARLVTGPVLLLVNQGQFQISFDSRKVVALDEAPVYPEARITDAWGKLVVGDGVMIPQDFSRFIVAAPAKTDGPHIEGPGWVLDLAPGWVLAPGDKPGSYVVKKG